ncbi:Dihydropyrimidine dehydrogenase [Datura stramonium]|uniref:Dihydropyrimidine dehydrogenase [NADP(+)] n=1 Tax=Datura stramonium TaxID=4076 RepID=A0ABS8S1Z4_DATST|nr:Dihydropyrimidine dehydrogenase [NADP(+)] [Datura stramonium]
MASLGLSSTNPGLDLTPLRPVCGADLRVTVNGLKMPNPFVIGSGPPGTNYTVMKRAFDEGWGGVIAPKRGADLVPVVLLSADANGSAKGQIIGWQNIELISDRPLETMLKEFRQLKEEYPNRILIASIMEEYNKAAWEELVYRVEETGIDAIEINFSCPMVCQNVEWVLLLVKIVISWRRFADGSML